MSGVGKSMTEKNEKASGSSKLHKLLEKANVPSLPAVARKLIQLCQNDFANFGDFAKVIEADPGLSSRLLRMSNSAYYGLREKVTSVERAISALGLKHVKSVCLGFHLTSALSQNNPDGFDMGKFWQQSLLRGCLARQLADRYCPAKREEAFLIGLLQDCGTPFLVQALGKDYINVWQDTHVSQAAFYKLEEKLFDFTHITAAEAITEKWELPEELSIPIVMHHQRDISEPSEDDMQRLSQISYFVATLSFHNPEKVCEDDLQLLEYSQNVFGIDEKELQKVLNEARTEFNKTTDMFSNVLDDETDISELLSEARDMILDLETQKARELMNLEAELKQLQDVCDVLNEAVEQSQQQANTDELTGLYVRGVLKDYVDTACKKVQHGEESLTLLFIDIDNFKRFNDDFCHAVGDRAIQCVSGLLKAIIPSDSCISRFGGDEFVIANVGLQPKEAIDTTKKLLEEFRKMRVPIREEPKGLDITCSVGMVYCEPGSHPANLEQIQEIADHKMYEAKRGGKNAFCYDIMVAKSALEKQHVETDALS